MRRILAVLLSLTLALTMMPAGVFATTWGDGNSKEEQESVVIFDYDGQFDPEKYVFPSKINWIKFKSGAYEPFTITNIDEEIGNTNKVIDKEMKATIAKYEMYDWITMAEKIFKSQSGVVGSKLGPTYSGMIHEFPYYFESGDDRISAKVPMTDWLRSDKEKDDDHIQFPMRGTWACTGLKKASSLNEVREKMAELCQNKLHSSDTKHKHFNKTNILTQKNRATLSSMMDTSSREVYYTIFAHGIMELAEADNTQYNAYGVALYDLEVAPVSGDGLMYANQKDNVKGTETGDKQKTFWVDHNKTSLGQETCSMTIGTDETQSVGKTDTSGWSWGVNAGFKFSVEIGVDKVPVKGGGEFAVSGDFNKMQEHALEQGWSQTVTGSSTNEISFDMDPHTSQKATQNHVKKNGYITYDTPVVVRYKVAVFSLGGTYQGFLTTFGNRVDFCTFFDGSSNDSWDAVSSLYDRTQNENLSGDPGGRTEGWTNGSKVTSEVKWGEPCLMTEEVNKSSGKRVDMSQLIKDRASVMPMLGVGSQMNITEDGYSQATGETVPLFPLREIRSGGEIEKEYSMVVGETMSLDHFDVEGYDNDATYGSVPYYGFSSDTGDWDVAVKDRAGNVLPEGIISVTKDVNSRSVAVHADRVPEEGEVAYITWNLNDTTEYISKDGTVVSNKKNRPDYPFIKINVYPDIKGSKVEFAATEASVPAGEELQLKSALPVNVIDEDGIIKSHDVTYILQDQTIPESVAKISSDGVFLASKEGSYRIKARYGANGSFITSEDTATVTVEPARQLILQPLQGKSVRHSEWAMAQVNVGDLVVLRDQYGEKWRGEHPQLQYQLVNAAGNVLPIADTAQLTANGQLRSRINGTHYVKVSVKGHEKTSAIVPITVMQSNPMTAAGKSVKVKHSKLKKKSQKISAKKAYKVKGAEGKVTFKKVSGNKKFKVAKNGTITAGKGLKKGTYKVKVRVTAAGNADYQGAAKNVTVKIRVKQ